jgi:hypothetical protein
VAEVALGAAWMGWNEVASTALLGSGGLLELDFAASGCFGVTGVGVNIGLELATGVLVGSPSSFGLRAEGLDCGRSLDDFLDIEALTSSET